MKIARAFLRAFSEAAAVIAAREDLAAARDLAHARTKSDVVNAADRAVARAAEGRLDLAQYRLVEHVRAHDRVGRGDVTS